MDLKTLLDTPPWDWPRDAGKTFRKFLNDRRAKLSDRLIAAELAGDVTVISNDMAKALLTVLRNSDEPEELRAKAAISFGAALESAWTEFDEESGRFDDPECVPISEGVFRNIQDEFQKLYSDTGIPKQVRRRILEAAVRAPEPWHDDAIREAYASGDREWMLTAVFAMRFVRGFETEVLESLNNPDADTHYEAVHAAGNKELDPAWPHIIALVQDEGAEKDLRIAAIEAAGKIRPADAQGILLELSESGDDDIAEAAERSPLHDGGTGRRRR